MIIAILVEVTILLLAGLTVQLAMSRSPAARHAVLLWSLLAVGVSPLALLAWRPIHLAPRIPMPRTFAMPAPVEIAFSGAASAPLPHVQSSRLPVGLSTLILSVWAAGAMTSCVFLGLGFRRLGEIERGARPECTEGLTRALTRLLAMHSGPMAEVLISDHITTPLTLGFLRPVVVIPAGLARSLDETALLQILLHEQAHVWRHDPLVGLYQRMLTAAFWFHPLIYLANRQLDRAREELCDNHVIQTFSPSTYARTLLKVAESFSRSPAESLAPGLIRNASQLEHRVAALLSQRRRVMTHWSRWKASFVGGISLALALGLGCMGQEPATQPAVQESGMTKQGVVAPMAQIPATQPSGSPAMSAQVVLMGNIHKDQNGFVHADHIVVIHNTPALPYKVKCELGAGRLAQGDAIVITEVRGTSETMTKGNIYLIKGMYTLASHDKAMIAAFTTAKNAAEGSGPYLKVQTAMVSKGDGSFSLFLPMSCDGWPHISFYPAEGGDDFGGVYFGTGDTVLKHWWGE